MDYYEWLICKKTIFGACKTPYNIIEGLISISDFVLKVA